MCPYTSSIDCCIGHSNRTRAGPDLVGDSGDCSCMSLVQPTPTCTDACPELLQLELVLLFPSINWSKHSTCTCGDDHPLELLRGVAS